MSINDLTLLIKICKMYSLLKNCTLNLSQCKKNSKFVQTYTARESMDFFTYLRYSYMFDEHIKTTPSNVKKKGSAKLFSQRDCCEHLASSTIILKNIH